MASDTFPTPSTHRAFDFLGSHDLSEYRSRGDHYLHRKSGCQVFHVANDDPENLFCFAFSTPPENSTGVAHIMEHTVLCGSQRFDIKDPFITLYRGSMNTYLNAGTGSTDTIYPAASVVEKDFFNLMMIYGDAVFFPLLKKEAFRQEGHHLEFDDQGRLIRTGIVYNEMKGDYSSFDSVVSEMSYSSLYKTGPLRFDAGGDPDHIPELTYEDFCAFHDTYYHPTNCRIFLYGNIPAEKTLAFLDENFLSSFDRRDLTLNLPLQERWQTPETRVVPGPASEDDSGCTHSVNWLLEPVEKVDELTALRVLSAILLGHSGAPLQMAVEQSELGDDLSPVSGIDLALYETLFSVGIRGAEKDRAKDFEELVFSTLESIVKEGLSPELVEGTFRRQEFREREIRGGIPFGYRLMHKSIRGWLHGLGPVDTMRFEEPLARVRDEARTPGYFENLIEKYLLRNPHRSLVTIYPDGEMLSRRDQAQQEELSRVQSVLDPKEKEAIDAENAALLAFQEKPDDPSVIPCLQRDDIPRRIITIPSRWETRGAITHFTHEFFTNGVLYLDMYFPLEDMSRDELRWLPFFSQVFFEVGTSDWEYYEASKMISLKLGGISAALEAGSNLESGELISHLVIRAKMLKGQMDEAMDLVEHFLHRVDFADVRRLKELLAELKNDYKSSFVPSGSSYAVSHTVRGVSPSTALDEMWYGLEQYYHLMGTENSEAEAEKLGRLFRSLKDKILRLGKCQVNITSDPGRGGELAARVEGLLARLETSRPGKPIFPDIPDGVKTDAFQITADVSYLGAALPGAMLGTREYCAQLVLTHLLKTGYLWEEVRMKGGAYGASVSLSGLDGYLAFSSYRDPRVLETVEAFRKGLTEYPESLTQADLDRALIGLIGRELKPLAPMEKGLIAMRRTLYSITDEMRQAKRDMLLDLTVDEVKRAGRELGEKWADLTLTVIAGKAMLDAASESMGDLKANRKILL